MNLNDIECVGAHAFGFVDYVTLNSFKVEKEYLLSNLNDGFRNSFDMLKNYGIKIPFAGGETADLPDQVRTFDVSGTIVARVDKRDVITGEMIEPGNKIIGIRSSGKAKYEHALNTGIMCNGITLARHCLMKNRYEKKYPEIRAPDGAEYYGRYEVGDYLKEVGLNVSEAITSPTRLFSPIIEKILELYGGDITGMAFNSGGGQTKCKRLGKNIHYVKDNLFEPDPIFILIQQESKEQWKDMFQDFNMGNGFDIIVEEIVAEEILSIPESFGVDAQIIGYCEKSDGKNKVTIDSRFGKFEYV